MDGLISRYISTALALALMSALSLAAWQWSRAVAARAEVDKISRTFAEYRETQERQAKEDLQTLRAEKAHGDKLRQEALDAEHIARLAAQADADRLRVGTGRLQRFATDLATSLNHAQRDPAATAGSPPAGAAADLLAIMLGRIDDAAAGIAVYADQARLAGQLCQRSYDTLTP